MGIKKKYANNIPRKKNIIDIIDTNPKTFFSFLYKAGDVKRIIWIIKIGKENKKETNNETLRFETKTSGRPVKIIRLFS